MTYKDIINAEKAVQQELRKVYTEPTIQNISNEIELFFCHLDMNQKDMTERCCERCVKLINEFQYVIAEELGDLKDEFLNFEKKARFLMDEILF